MYEDTLKTVADLMALSARTAPKGGGRDYVVDKVLSTKEEIEALARAMEAFGNSLKGKPFVLRDAKNIRNSGAVLLLGIKDAQPSGLNCGACGFDTCAEVRPHDGPEFRGPYCALRIMDLGIALSSAAKTAMNLNADNRMMYSAGSAAVQAGLFDADVAIAIPVAAYGKNIYFDRG